MRLIAPLLLLLLLMFAGAASAGTADVAQVGGTIYVWGAGWADLTYIETQVSNASALTHTGTVFLAGANLHVNGTGTTLYINDTDCTWLKLNCTFGDVSDLRCDGYFEMNNSKITSWNTSTTAICTQDASNMATARSAIRFGNDVDNCGINISNTNISYVGYNVSMSSYGLYATQWHDGTIFNTTIYKIYSTLVTKSVDTTINHTKIYNSTAKGLSFHWYNDNNVVKNTEIWNNNHIAQYDTSAGCGMNTVGTSNGGNYFCNLTVHDNYGTEVTLNSGANDVITMSEVYGSGRLLEIKGGCTNAIAEYNTVHDGWRGLYNVYGNTNIYRHNTVYNCTEGGIVLYSVSDSYNKMYNNTVYNCGYNIQFSTSPLCNNTLHNNTITGAATSYDINADYATNCTIWDLDNYDDDLKIRLKYGTPTLYINYSSNEIMSNTSEAGLITTNVYYPTHSSLFLNSTVPTYPTVYLYDGTLTAGTTNLTLVSVNKWNETAGSESYNITVDSSNHTETCTFTADVANHTDHYGCYVDGIWSENVQASAGVASWMYTGGFSEHDLEIRWNSSDTTNRYVATWGDNTSDGSFAHPWQNVSYATQQATAGGTIHLFNGTWYDEHALFANSGNATHRITLSTYNGTARFDGMDLTGTCLRIDTKEYITITGPMFIYNYAAATSVGDSRHVTISNIEADGGWNTGDPNGVSLIQNGDSTNITITDSTFYDSAWNTVSFHGPHGGGTFATHFVIRNCTIYHSNAHNAIDFFGDVKHAVVEDCTIHNCTSGGIYDHDNPDTLENVTIRDNVFRDLTTYGVAFTDSTAGIWVTDVAIYNNTFDNISLAHPIELSNIDNVTIYNNSFYTTVRSVGRLYSNALNVTYDDNYAANDCGHYYVSSGSKVTVRNPTGEKTVYLYGTNSSADLGWDDGTVFTAAVDKQKYVSYFSDVRYYPDHSNCSAIKNATDGVILSVSATYNITLYPTNAYLKDVTMNHESDAADDRTNITVNSSVSTNPTWINATMQNATHNYSIAIDGAVVDYVNSDSGGVVRYQYSSAWSEHDFEFVWVGAAPFVPDHTKAYYNVTSHILCTMNSTGYYIRNRTITSSDIEICSGSTEVTI